MATRLTVVRIVSQIRSELDRILEDESGLREELSAAPSSQPRLDVAQSGESLCLLVEVPGAEASDLEVQVTDDLLTVTGRKRPSPSPPGGARYLQVERQLGHFERSVELPAPVNPRQGRASLERGVLRIDLPLLQDQRNQTHRLTIDTNEEEEE